MTGARDELIGLLRDHAYLEDWRAGIAADAILAAGWRPVADLRARVAEELRKADEDFDANSASSFRQVLRMIDGACSCDHPEHSEPCDCGCRLSTTR